MIARHPRTTAREWQVMVLRRRRYSFDEIGRELGISEHTARLHSRNVRERLGLGTEGEALDYLGLTVDGPMLTAPTHRTRRRHVPEGQMEMSR